jgi:hypothetical protein
MSCKWPNDMRVQVSNLLNCVIMFDGDTLPVLDIVDLAMEASDLLDQFRRRGMDDLIQRSVVKKAFEAENLGKLKGLVVKF